MSFRLLVINWQDPEHPLAGGAEVHFQEVFSRLVHQYDYQVTLLACSFPGAPSETEIEGIRVLRRGSRSTFNFIVPWVYRQELRQEPFDLVIEDLNKIPFYTRFYIATPKLALLHHFFGRTIYQETHPILATYVYLTERSVPKLYRGIPFVAVSQSTKEDLVRHGIPERDVTVIYNGVSDFYFPTFEVYDRPTVLYLGRLKKYKRIDLVLQVFREILREILDARLLIVGDGDARPGLMQLAKDLGLESSVTFTGFVSEEAKRTYLQKSWVILNTSPKEGFGLVVLEAQACGTPAVVLNSPGLRETVRHGETGWIASSLEEMTQQTLQILKDPSLRTRMGKAAVNWARTFSWDRAAEEFHHLIHRILA